MTLFKNIHVYYRYLYINILFSEAIKAIIEYTPSAIELLKRKKVKRDILFKFLAEQKVCIHYMGPNNYMYLHP
jgi:hypothetical protein